MSNRSDGNKFEQKFCEILFGKGFWVHNLAQNSAGQPADVIAVRNGKAYLIDCKVCKNNKFPLSRIEDNQHFAMNAWCDSGNGRGWFAMLMDDEIYMISHFALLLIQQEKRTATKEDIETFGVTLEEWLNQCS